MRWAGELRQSVIFILMANIDDLIKKARALDGFTIKAGILKGATYPDTGQSVVQVAYWQEYGVPSRGIPPRPFIKSTEAAKLPEWRVLRDKHLARYIKGEITLENVRTIVGGQMAADIKATIKEGVEPPLSPVTVMTRHLAKKKGKRNLSVFLEAKERIAKGEVPPSGDDTPLYDTHVLYNAIDYE